MTKLANTNSPRRPMHEYVRPIVKYYIIEKLLRQFRSGKPPKKRGERTKI